MSSLHHLRAVMTLFWADNRLMLAAGALLGLCTALAGVALLGLSGWFITATAIAGASVATAMVFDVFAPAAGIRFLALARTFSRYGERLVTHDATLTVLARLRERVFRGLAADEEARSLAARPARLLFRLTIDIDALDSLYLRVAVPLAAALGSALVTAAALGLVAPVLGVGIGLVLMLSGLAIPAVAAASARKPARRRAHALEVLRSRTIDLMRGQADLVMANRLAAQTMAVSDADARLADADDALNSIETNTGFSFAVAGAGLLAATLIAAAMLAESGAIGAPVAALAVFVALACLEPFAALRRGALELGRVLLSARRLGSKLADVADKATSPELPSSLANAVEIADVTASYRFGDRPVLEGQSLSIAKGEHVALIGTSGAGKSTILSLIAGELFPQVGAVRTLPAALLTQRTELFRDTLRGNLALARANAGDGEMMQALQAAGLGAFASSLPEGLDTMLGEGGTGLSAGQARRLALARLLLRDTSVWLLDEPTEGLDGPTARDVVERVGARAEGRTLVIVTHVRREAELADRILLVEQGGVRADCTRGSEEYLKLLDRLRPD
ncbi:amino acid ABC transporter ATP-binding/permease protein [Aquamicrobium ahrensii]|uniref:ATP-binding cassette subfamily C protein CydC n=1 Tax=Aquamicrobium ahrensii TaxID=469551 RepID=A0ABV2KNB0_9HYPH